MIAIVASETASEIERRILKELQDCDSPDA
jgi:hypothetical protein